MPGRCSGPLLATVAPSAATTLSAVPTAGVALLTLAIPAADWPERLHGLSGFLVPKPRQRLVTAASFGSQKWAHWAIPDHVVLRVSLGRDGLPALHLTDDQLLVEVLDELRRHLDIDAQPTRGSGQPVAELVPPVPAASRRRHRRRRAITATRFGTGRGQLPRHRRAGVHPLGPTSRDATVAAVVAAGTLVPCGEDRLRWRALRC